MFCEKCGSLLYPEGGKLVCRKEGCNFSRDITERDNSSARIVRDRKKENRDILILEEITEAMPKTRIECPKCGHHEAYWRMTQTRAADEPTTRIYRCTKCRHTWREF